MMNQSKRKPSMKLLKTITIACALCGAVLASPARAQTNSTPPVIVDPNKNTVSGDIQEIKTLIKDFEITREAYLANQKSLLEQLKGATTDEQKEAIRKALEANRDAFLADLRAFRLEIREELRQLKGLINNAELQRLIAAAQAASGDHHKKK
jgi:hypothetical protein